MEAETTSIDGLVVLRAAPSGRDERGVVREFFRSSDFADNLGLQLVWRQINVTETTPGAVRGLHGEPMTKLVGIACGKALGAYIDTRASSATFRQVCLVELAAGTRVVVPRGVCNGFQSLGPGPSSYVYAFDEEWRPGMGGAAVNPIDKSLGFEWPIAVKVDDTQQISAKDAGLPRFSDVYGVSPLPPPS
jgi:dTDP-4-dehydrorhamnose 3,5-epimerase